MANRFEAGVHTSTHGIFVAVPAAQEEFAFFPPGHPVLHSDKDHHLTVEGRGCHRHDPSCYHANHGTLMDRIFGNTFTDPSHALRRN